MSVDELIDKKIEEAVGPLLNRIKALEKQVADSQKEQPFLIKGRPAIRAAEAAKIMGVSRSTINRYLSDPLHPLQGTKRGKLLYIYEDTINS